MPNDERILETMPTGTLGLIPTASCMELGKKVDSYLSTWREHREHEHQDDIAFKEYHKESYIIEPHIPRFGSGEAKCVINQSVRGYDLYIMVDVTNYSMTYSLCGQTNHMSPDDHFADLKRVIAAVGGKARRITVILPFLYESRQHRRTARESLDCPLALQELYDMGMFYKRRDFSRVVDGRNPIVAHEFLGSNVEGKDVLIIDDMISSGESMIDTARELKKRKANRIFVVSTFGLFTNGLASFDKAYEEGLIYRVVTTNLIYQTPELLSREYYISCDMSKYIAYIIDTLNHDSSISDLLNPYDRIKNYVKKYNDAKNA